MSAQAPCRIPRRVRACNCACKCAPVRCAERRARVCLRKGTAALARMRTRARPKRRGRPVGEVLPIVGLHVHEAYAATRAAWRPHAAVPHSVPSHGRVSTRVSTLSEHPYRGTWQPVSTPSASRTRAPATAGTVREGCAFEWDTTRCHAAQLYGQALRTVGTRIMDASTAARQEVRE